MPGPYAALRGSKRILPSVTSPAILKPNARCVRVADQQYAVRAQGGVKLGEQGPWILHILDHAGANDRIIGVLLQASAAHGPQFKSDPKSRGIQAGGKRDHRGGWIDAANAISESRQQHGDAARAAAVVQYVRTQWDNAFSGFGKECSTNVSAALYAVVDIGSEFSGCFVKWSNGWAGFRGEPLVATASDPDWTISVIVQPLAQAILVVGRDRVCVNGQHSQAGHTTCGNGYRIWGGLSQNLSKQCNSPSATSDWIQAFAWRDTTDGVFGPRGPSTVARCSFRKSRDRRYNSTSIPAWRCASGWPPPIP